MFFRIALLLLLILSWSPSFQCFVPSRADALLRQDSELIGRLYYKEGHDLYHWRMGWFALVGSELYLCSGDEDEEDGVLQLKRLQELSKKRTQKHSNKHEYMYSETHQ